MKSLAFAINFRRFANVTYARPLQVIRSFAKISEEAKERFQLPPCNNEINVPQIRLISQDGKQIGVMPTSQALELAQKQNLDLIGVKLDIPMPIAKLGDKRQLRRDLLEQQKVYAAQLPLPEKEIIFRAQIEANDLATKVSQARRLLDKCHPVRVVVWKAEKDEATLTKANELLLAFFDKVKDIAKKDIHDQTRGFMILNNQLSRAQKLKLKKEAEKKHENKGTSAAESPISSVSQSKK